MPSCEFAALDGSENITCLNLNDFTVTDFLEYVYPLYMNNNQILKLNFFGDCEFGFVAHRDFIFILLKNRNAAMANALQQYTELCMASNFTFCFRIFSFFEGRLPGIEDLKIITDMWQMHNGFQRIDLPEHNISFQRLAPTRLEIMCQRLLKDSSFEHLPKHVSRKLKRTNESSQKNNGSKRLAKK